MKYLVMSVSALALFAGPASAVVLDEFNGSQIVEDVAVNPPPPSASEQDGLAVPGGSRDLEAQNDDGIESGTDVVVGSGLLAVNNAAGNTGNGIVTWDGDDDDPLNVATSGLGGLDLLGGSPAGNLFFFFDVVQNDGVFDYDLTVWDTLGGSATAGGQIGTLSPDDSTIRETLAFSLFSGVDFTEVGAIQLAFSTDDAAGDIAIDNFGTQVVPLPAALPMMLGALGGLGFLGWRRKRA